MVKALQRSVGFWQSLKLTLQNKPYCPQSLSLLQPACHKPASCYCRDAKLPSCTHGAHTGLLTSAEMLRLWTLVHPVPAVIGYRFHTNIWTAVTSNKGLLAVVGGLCARAVMNSRTAQSADAADKQLRVVPIVKASLLRFGT